MSYTNLNPDIKKRWLEVLRSNEYKQGRKALRLEDNSYCCLGVLQDMLEPDCWSDYILEQGTYNCYQTKDGYYTDLSYYLLEMTNLTIHNMTILQYMNDTGKSFEEIAQWIEENL
jgi:hypothetical protein